MISLRLPKEIEHLLNNLAENTGRTKAFYVREALERHLEDMEDAYLADKSYDDLQNNKGELISHKEFWNELDD